MIAPTIEWLCILLKHLNIVCALLRVGSTIELAIAKCQELHLLLLEALSCTLCRDFLPLSLLDRLIVFRMFRNLMTFEDRIDFRICC